MRIIFAGTPSFAVPALLTAVRLGQVVAVYTQPDRPAGRSRQLQPSPIKQHALVLGLPIIQPERIKEPEAIVQMKRLHSDLMIVVGYGQILPQQLLNLPRKGCWNVHASLLPRWRGAAPIQRAIEAGDRQTGICLMQMENGLDQGPVLLKAVTAIGDDETAGQLHDRLAQLGADVLANGLTLALNGLLPQATPQSTQGVTYANKLMKTHAYLDWSLSAIDLARKVRAFHPWPIAETMLAHERVRIHHAEAIEKNHSSVPGRVLEASKHALDIACGQGVLRLLQVQRPGGLVISAVDYINARRHLCVDSK